MVKAIILVGLIWGATGIEGVPLARFDTMQGCVAVLGEMSVNPEVVEPGTALGLACVEFQAKE